MAENQSKWEERKAWYLQRPEVQKALEQGRLGLPSENDWKKASAEDLAKHFDSQLNTIKEQDKRVGQYYKLATGQDATPDVIDKFSEYANDPALLAAAINKEATMAPATGGFKDQINASIQEKLGRDATSAELGYFGKQMEQGNLDAYGLGEFLSGTTEYQQKYTDTARTKLAGELSATDTEYLAKIQKGLESKYAAMGRPGASAFGSALIGAGKDLAAQRTGYLADIGYQSALGGQESMKAAYQNRLAQMYASQQNLPTAQGQSAQRYYSQQDYDRQAAAQERLARLSQPKQGSFLQSLIPGVVQGGLSVAGSYLGRPQATNYNMYGGW